MLFLPQRARALQLSNICLNCTYDSLHTSAFESSKMEDGDYQRPTKRLTCTCTRSVRELLLHACRQKFLKKTRPVQSFPRCAWVVSHRLHAGPSLTAIDPSTILQTGSGRCEWPTGVALTFCLCPSEQVLPLLPLTEDESPKVRHVTGHTKAEHESDTCWPLVPATFCP